MKLDALASRLPGWYRVTGLLEEGLVYEPMCVAGVWGCSGYDGNKCKNLRYGQSNSLNFYNSLFSDLFILEFMSVWDIYVTPKWQKRPKKTKKKNTNDSVEDRSQATHPPGDIYIEPSFVHVTFEVSKKTLVLVRIDLKPFIISWVISTTGPPVKA